MKIIHRISFNAKGRKEAIKQFQKLGIAMKVSVAPAPFSSHYHFDMSEDDHLWPEVEKVLLSAGILITKPHTEFTREEIMSSERVLIYPHHRWGYPMPNDYHWQWKERAYTPEQECEYCGIGLRQKAPIHLKCEPKMGRNHFMGVFWLDEIFALNKVFDVLSQNGITGFEAYPAIHYKKKTPLETVKQLKVVNELAPGVIPDNLTRADVEGITADNIITHKPYPCGHVKYIGLGRGMYRFSRNIFRGMPDLVKTHEWFGGMRSAVQFILASAKFVKVYMENNWKGLSLNPIELV
jgi:hypothetical protein